MKKILLFVLVAAIAGTGCKKSNNECKLDANDITGSYKVTHSYYKADATSTEVDEYLTWDACEKDDIITLNTGGAAVFQDAGVVCTPPGDEAYIWTLSGNNFTIDSETYAVSGYSCSGMTLTYTNSSGGYQKIVLEKL